MSSSHLYALRTTGSFLHNPTDSILYTTPRLLHLRAQIPTGSTTKRRSARARRPMARTTTRGQTGGARAHRGSSSAVPSLSGHVDGRFVAAGDTSIGCPCRGGLDGVVKEIVDAVTGVFGGVLKWS